MSKEQSQEYRGNGQHVWEKVVMGSDDPKAASATFRLRVPGGWIYSTSFTATQPDGYRDIGHSQVFVPMPEVVKHVV